MVFHPCHTHVGFCLPIFNICHVLVNSLDLFLHVFLLLRCSNLLKLLTILLIHSCVSSLLFCSTLFLISEVMFSSYF